MVNLDNAKKAIKKDFFDEKSAKIIFPIINMLFTFFIFNMVFSIAEYGMMAPLTFSDIIFSVYLGVVTYLFMLGVFGRTLLTTIVYDILVCLLMFTNKLKIMYVGEPLYLSDFKFIVNIGGFVKLAFGNLNLKAILTPILPTVFMAIWAFVMIFLGKKYRAKVPAAARIVMLIVTCVMIFALAKPTIKLKTFMEKYVYKVDSYEDYNSYVDNKSYYFYYGFANGMYGNYLNNVFFEPDGYNEEVVENVLETNVIKSSGVYGKPNIILWLSESFFDIKKLDKTYIYPDPIPNFREYSESEKHINVLSPSYGGASENVAFEILTGGSMKYFPNGYIPVMSLYGTDKSEGKPSIVRELKNNGYRTSYIFGKDFYNSKTTYTRMGFDEYVDLSKENAEVTDSLITQEVIKLLKQEGNQFITVASYEAHMPYNKRKYKEYSLSISPVNINEDEIDTLRAYAESIYRADKELKVLYDYIQRIEEPTIIIFIPDHLPYLYTENNDNLLDSYFKDEFGDIDYYKMYNNEGLLLSNYDLDFSEVPDYIGADQLLNAVVQNTEVDLSSYYDYLYSILDKYSGMNKYITVKKDGLVYNKENIPVIIKEIEKIRRDVQYKLFINN